MCCAFDLLPVCVFLCGLCFNLLVYWLLCSWVAYFVFYDCWLHISCFVLRGVLGTFVLMLMIVPVAFCVWTFCVM